jgi:hypothetical protein
MNPTLFASARTFIYASARLLERQLFAVLFEDGDPRSVISALRAYQNPDGGFGNALESDLRTPVSQPLAAERAFQTLDLIGRFEPELVLPACDWLQRVSTAPGGVPFALPGLEAYPHTPWMQADPQAQLNPTAGLCALLLRNAVRHPWVELAAGFCWQRLASFESDAFHDILPIVEFIAAAPGDPQRSQAALEHWRAIAARSGVINYDPQAGGYVKGPLDFAPHPDSPLRDLFSAAEIERQLDALQARQQADGGWPINWQALSPAAEAEWRGWVTLQAMLTLRAYGR